MPIHKLSRIPQGRHAGSLSRSGDIERTAQTVQHVGDRARSIAPAEAQPREPVRLREGPDHDDVVARTHEFDTGIVTVLVDELGYSWEEIESLREDGAIN